MTVSHTKLRSLGSRSLFAQFTCFLLIITIILTNAKQDQYGLAHRNTIERSYSRLIHHPDLKDCLATLRDIKKKNHATIQLPESCCRLLKSFPTETTKEKARLYCSRKKHFFRKTVL